MITQSQQCPNCGLLILDPGVSYGINPTAVCICHTPSTDNNQREIFITKDVPSLLKHVGTNKLPTDNKADERYDVVRVVTDICFDNGGVTKPMADKLADYVLSYAEKARETAALDARIEEHISYKNTLLSVIELYPTDNDWARGRKQGIQDCIDDQDEYIIALTNQLNQMRGEK